MKILIVASGNHAQIAPFVMEQSDALRQAGCEIQLFAIEGHGISGYLHNLSQLRKSIRNFCPDVVHAHYGLCGLLCTLQHRVPVVITYHGSDINNPKNLRLSRIAMRRAAHNIFVSKKLQIRATSKYPSISCHASVIPCGVDTSLFHPTNREEACQTAHLDPLQRHILFAGAFDNEVKNPRLAKEAFNHLIEDCKRKDNVHLLELKGYGREEVAALMNAADCLLMTSHSEGSPQVTKEALACGLPIVSVDVGDVKVVVDGIEGCHISKSENASELAELLNLVLERNQRIDGPRQIQKRQIDNRSIAKQLVNLYNKIQ